MDATRDDDVRFKLLLSLDIFRNLDIALLRSLARSGTWLTFETTQTLFTQGDECNSLLIVDRGRVSLSLLSMSGHELILAEAGAGSFLGDVELVLGRRRLYNGVALEPIRVLSLRRAAFDDLLRSSAFATSLLQAVCARWCRLAQIAETMALNSLEQRLASLLLELCRDHGRSVEGGTLIDHAISQTRMAQLINASRPKVNVQLRRWKERGLIAGARDRIVVRNAKALKSIAAAASRP